MARSRKKTAVSAILGEAECPIYLLDANRRILYCNEACCRWVCRSAEQLVGLQCDYHSHDAATTGRVPNDEKAAPSEVATGLCPSIESFGGVKSDGVVMAPTGARRRAEFIPLSSSPAADVLVIVDLHDLSKGTDEHRIEQDEERFLSNELHDQVRYWRRQQQTLYAMDNLLGSSTAIRRAREQVRLAATGDCSVVVLGEPGTGRERVLRTIHASRADAEMRPLIPLDCQLLDSELIQATMDRILRQFRELQNEHAPELLLLDVDQLSLDAQATLLAILRSSETKLSTLATSASDLTKLVKEREYLSDLASSLSTLVIELPPLSERVDDLPVLVQAAVECENERSGKQIQGVTERAMNLLLAHRWSGNVDQLFDFVRESHESANGTWITDEDLPEAIALSLEADRHPRRERQTIELEAYLANVERELIRRALEAAKGNKAEAARLLSVSRGRLLRRIEALGIDG